MRNGRCGGGVGVHSSGVLSSIRERDGMLGGKNRWERRSNTRNALHSRKTALTRLDPSRGRHRHVSSEWICSATSSEGAGSIKRLGSQGAGNILLLKPRDKSIWLHPAGSVRGIGCLARKKCDVGRESRLRSTGSLQLHATLGMLESIPAEVGEGVGAVGKLGKA